MLKGRSIRRRPCSKLRIYVRKLAWNYIHLCIRLKYRKHKKVDSMFEKVYREKQTMLMSHKERFRKVEGVKKVLHWVVNFHIICGNL